MSRELVVLVTLIAYKAVLVAIGLLARGRNRDAADFYLAGRDLGPAVAALSASASSSSAWTLLGVSGMAYASGLSAVWLFPACVGGFVINWFVLAPNLRRLSRASGAITATDVVAGAPGRPLRRTVSTIASVIILSSLLTYVATQFQGAGKSFSETFGLDDTASILIGAAVVVFYTMVGGFWAVSLTDTLQGLVMAVVTLLLPVAALLAIGPSELVTGLRQVPVDGYLSLTRDAGPVAGAGFLLGLLGIGLGYPGQPHVVNRFMALRGEREVAVARRIAVAWAVVVYAGMTLLGLCARVLYPEVADPEKAFLTAANGLFPPVVAGVMVAAVLSAVMSTADSQLLVAASTVNHDLGLGRGRADRVRSARLVVLLLSLGAVAAAVFGEASIFRKVLFAWSSMGCAFGPLLLVTALCGPVRPGATVAAMVTGFSLSVGAYAARQAGELAAWAGVWERVIPFALALAIAWLGRDKEAVADSAG